MMYWRAIVHGVGEGQIAVFPCIKLVVTTSLVVKTSYSYLGFFFFPLVFFFFFVGGG